MVIAFLPVWPGNAKETGESLFIANCMAFHTIGKGRLVNPDLNGVHVK